MAVIPQSLLTQGDSIEPPLRFHNAYSQPKKFAAVGANKEWPVLTPVAVDAVSGLWAIYDSANANRDEVKGFLLNPSQMLTTGETIHTVILRGQVHRNDVWDPASDARQGTAANAPLDAELKTKMRAIGIDVQGLEGVY